MKIWSNLLMVAVMLFTNCKPDRDDEVPYLPFEDIIVNTSLPEYFALQSPGNFKYLNGGVKGIILYRKNADTFYAFERNCTFTPNEACSTVEVDATFIQMSDPCCGTSFNFDGIPVSGPASRELRRYKTEYLNGTVIVTDEVVNGI